MKLNIRAKTSSCALNKFKKRYGKNHISLGINYNKDMPKNKFGMKSYSVKYRMR